MQPFVYGSQEFFRYQLIKGQIAKELVKGLLESSNDYQVYSFGYESSISPLRIQVNQNRGRGIDHTPSNDRMRSMPDLIVYDKELYRTSFVEVKFRGVNSPNSVPLSTRELSLSNKYWNDCIWIVVIPAAHNFYAQKISDIRIFDEVKTHRYDLTRDFRPIQQEFPKVTFDNIERYWKIRGEFLIPNGLEDEG